MKKVGIYKLSQLREIADDWIVVIDESIEFGHEKLLVMFGIRESNIDFSRPVQYGDVIYLNMRVSGSWKGEEIKKVLDELMQQIGSIKYVVSDMGHAIKKALTLSSIVHVEDVTHKISWIIKELYKHDEQFKSYTEKLAHLRGSLCLSSASHLLPPQQRINSRYMNLNLIFQWGKDVIQMLNTKQGSEEDRSRLLFIRSTNR